jgi:hypothetical protein
MNLRRYVWWALIGSVLLVGGWGIWLVQKPRGASAAINSVAPPPATVLDPQGVGHPGDPKNAEKDLQQIYLAIDKFRRQNGRLPNLPELGGSKATGLPGLLPAEAWTNPDTRYSDGLDPKGRGSMRFHYQVSYLAARPDGSQKPAFPKKGERDVWILADQCVRKNMVRFSNHRVAMTLKGCFVVLWSDGTIERIHPAKQLVVPVTTSRSGFAFEGQAGLPKDRSRVKTFPEYWRSKSQTVNVE